MAVFVLIMHFKLTKMDVNVQKGIMYQRTVKNALVSVVQMLK